MLAGTALKNKGVQTMLDAVVAYLPSPSTYRRSQAHPVDDDETVVERHASDEEPLTALAFKVVSDPFVGRLVFFRVYSGVARSGDQVLNTTRDRASASAALCRCTRTRART